MPFVLRRPLRLPSYIAVASKSALKPAPVRTLQAHGFFTSQTMVTTPIRSLAKMRMTFPQFRTYVSEPIAPTSSPNPALVLKLLVAGVQIGGTLLICNLLFNRETRDDGLSQYEQEYLNETFSHMGTAFGIMGFVARAMYQNSSCNKMMVMAQPHMIFACCSVAWVMFFVARTIHPDKYFQKYSSWSAFNISQAAAVAPLILVSPAFVGRAVLYTVAMMGSISIIGATAKQEKYIYLGGPLLAGAAIAAASGLAPFVLPATAIRTLSITENVWLHGGLAVFGGLTLFNVQEVLSTARMAERKEILRDTVIESMDLETYIFIKFGHAMLRLFSIVRDEFC